MRKLFLHRLYSQRLFCRRHQKVTGHGIYAREAYSTFGGMDPHIPLLCCCDSCGTMFVAFSHEFVFCRRDCINRDYTKIYGYNRIAPGNWIYFEEAPKPGIVKSFFQGPDKEVVVVNYDGGPDKKIELPKVTIEHEEAPEGYRLLPAQSSYTLLGDYVYHAIRHQFGLAVGLVNDGEKDKIVVLLKDNTLVFITLPPLAQNLPNEKLGEIVRGKLSQVFPEHCGKVSVEVGQGIVYLKGTVKNYSIQRAMEGCVNGLPKVRGCVNFTRLQVSPFVTDSEIENGIYEFLESPGMHLFDYRVSVSGGKVQIQASCLENDRPKDLETRLGEIPGVRDLVCLVTELSDPMNIDLCKEIETDFSMNALLRNTFIRVSCNNKKFLLEGRVQSTFQKQLALLTLLKKTKTTAVENRLRLA